MHPVDDVTGRLQSDDNNVSTIEVVSEYYDIHLLDTDHLVSMSDEGCSVEEMNGSMLNKRYPSLDAQEA